MTSALQLIPLPALVLSDHTFSYTNYTTSTSDRPTHYPTPKPGSGDRIFSKHITNIAKAIALHIIPLPALVLSARPTDYPTAKPISGDRTSYKTITLTNDDRSTHYPTARASIKRSHFLLHKLHN